MELSGAPKSQDYIPLPTIELFHQSMAQIRCIVGPVGSGKTSGATMETCCYLPHFIARNYGIMHTRWAVVRNTYRELIDTTCKTIMDPLEGWFSHGDYKASANEYRIDFKETGVSVDLMFRSCDRLQDVKKFKSLEITGYWIDESIEVKEEIKRMLKNRIGRYPRFETWANAIRAKWPKFKDLTNDQIRAMMEKYSHKFLTRFGIETTNPCDIEHPTYSEFNWHKPPPGPVPEGTPKLNHAGFWQPPRENEKYLRPGYYNDLIQDYADSSDWAEMYVEGKPGILIKGKLVYNNFKRDHHVAKGPIPWSGGKLYRGWDNSGNTPAAVIIQMPNANTVHVIREFTSDKMNIATFAEWVVAECAQDYIGAEFTDWGDPAGNQEFPLADGGWTSNAKIMEEAASVIVLASEQNLTARINAIDDQLLRIDGFLIDPSCIRFINGFLGGYCYKKLQASDEYSDIIDKNRFSHVHDAAQYVVLKLIKGGKKLGGVGFRPKR